MAEKSIDQLLEQKHADQFLSGTGLTVDTIIKFYNVALQKGDKVKVRYGNHRMPTTEWAWVRRSYIVGETFKHWVLISSANQNYGRTKES